MKLASGKEVDKLTLLRTGNETHLRGDILEDGELIRDVELDYKLNEDEKVEVAQRMAGAWNLYRQGLPGANGN